MQMIAKWNGSQVSSNPLLLLLRASESIKPRFAQTFRTNISVGVFYFAHRFYFFYYYFYFYLFYYHLYFAQSFRANISIGVFYFARIETKSFPPLYKEYEDLK